MTFISTPSQRAPHVGACVKDNKTSRCKTKKRRREPDANDASEKAMKWADEFDQLGEDDQYTYLEELAPRMTKMHLQFLQGILGI